MSLTALEQRYQFTFPPLYHQLEAAGMLNWGALGPHWFRDEFPRLKLQPPLLLFADDFELLDDEQLAVAAGDFLGATTRFEIDSRFRFAPFAMNGAGDSYCFLLSESDQGEMPVVLFWHDADRVSYLAKNLSDFIFVKMLDVITATEDEPLLDRDDIEAVCLLRYLATHRAFLQTEHAAVIEREFERFSRGELGEGLDEDALHTLILQYAPYEKYGHSFPYEPVKPVVPETEENKRRVGDLQLIFSATDASRAKQHALVKRLNWRAHTAAADGKLVLLRKKYVIFGIPSMLALDTTFRDALVAVRNEFPDCEISFTEHESQCTYVV